MKTILNLLPALLIGCMAVSCGNDEPNYKEQRVGKAIDLGLSVKWSSQNVGALEASAEGGLYGWSDYTGSRRTQTNIAVSYKADSTFVVWNSTFYGGKTPPANICATDSDIAYYSWGTTWRLPTKAEMQELIDRCTWESVTMNSQQCMKVTGPNGNSIVLPAAGYRSNETSREQRNTALCYWTGERASAAEQKEWKIGSSQLSTAWCLSTAGGKPQLKPEVRCFGLSVRPVCN